MYEILCGKKKETIVTVHQLDKTKYSIFRVKHLIFPDHPIIKSVDKFILIADIEGSVSGLLGIYNIIALFVKIKTTNGEYEEKLLCSIQQTDKIKKNYEIPCFIQLDSDYTTYKYEEIILLPYYTPENEFPFELIIKNSLKAINYSEYQVILSQTDKEPPSDIEPLPDKKNTTFKEPETEEIVINDNVSETPLQNISAFIKISLYLFLVLLLFLN